MKREKMGTEEKEKETDDRTYLRKLIRMLISYSPICPPDFLNCQYSLLGKGIEVFLVVFALLSYHVRND
jgi:hypothetical protein